jgi:hypothetical protein
MSSTRLCSVLVALATLAALPGCGDDDGVSSEEKARQAYYGLEKMVDRAMDLGFMGYNAASSANIPAQNSNGDISGTITVDGKVDQGSSDNKEMTLNVTLVDYADIKLVDRPLVYNTDDASPPVLALSLKKIPNGTLTGSLTGNFVVSGEIEGEVKLQLSITAELEPDPADNTKVRRKPGTIAVTGTATSPYGVYNVDVKL